MATSDIRPRSQDGSHTTSTFTSVTPQEQRSLADVAKQSEDERAKRGSAVKAFANADLPTERSGLSPVSATPTLVPAGKATPGIFDGVYRAAKAVEGATASGVNYVRFSELLQPFSSEIAIVKDQNLNAVDKHLMALFEEVLAHYGVSKTLWNLKILATEDIWNGEIPMLGQYEPRADRIAAAYKVPVLNRRHATGTTYKTLPGDTPQRVWIKAEEVLARATALYYGR